MNAKTHETAVVVIPPKDVWPPIQAIRQHYDRQFRRWMPHITLLYPFRPRELFDADAPAMEAAVSTRKPFEIQLVQFRHFRHSPGSFTLWLAPESIEPLLQLQAALQRTGPDCDEQSRHPGGFNPHLSVGQAHGPDQLAARKTELQAGFAPVTFVVDRVWLIWRGPKTDDVFVPDRSLPLGQPAADSV